MRLDSVRKHGAYGALDVDSATNRNALSRVQHYRAALVCGALLLVCVVTCVFQDFGFMLSLGRATSLALWSSSFQMQRTAMLASIGSSYPEDVAKDMNLSVDPCDNFYEYACGGWVNRTEIPADHSAFDRSFASARLETTEELRKLYEAEYPADSPYSDLHNFYASCMNETAIDDRGIAPALPYLERIDAVHTASDLQSLLEDLWVQGISPFFKFDAMVGLQNRSARVLMVKAGAILLQTGQYVGWPLADEEDWNSTDGDINDFLTLDNQSLPLRSALARYYARLFELSGRAPEAAARAAMRAVWAETAAAAHQLADESPPPHAGWGPRGPPPLSLAGLEAAAPGLPWRRVFERMSAVCAAWNTPCAQSILSEEERIILFIPRFAAGVSSDLVTWPPARWAPFLAARVLHSLGPLLPRPFLATALDFNRLVMGVEDLSHRSTQCVKATAHGLPWLSDPLYVNKTLPLLVSQTGLSLLRMVRGEFVEGIRGVDWMDNVTRERAVSKAERVQVNLGSQAISDYRVFKLPIRVDDFFTNSQLTYQVKVVKVLHYVDVAVDRRKWNMLATEVNAEYDNGVNAIFVPAAMMQAPFFDEDYKMERNYGGIGAIVGHELTHGFDSTGRRFDQNRELSDWWDQEVVNRFHQRAGCVGRLYGGFSTRDGGPLDGNKTLPENIADLGGAKLGYAAYLRWYREKYNGSEAPEEARRLYFVSYAQMWCSKVRPGAAAAKHMRDVHSPGVFRTNGVVSQNAEFAALFQCPVGSPMNPATKCVVWDAVGGAAAAELAQGGDDPAAAR